MQTSKIKEVSARVLLTPMPKDGVDQFTFMRPLGEIKPEKVEALLQFSQYLDPLYLMRGLNKLIAGYIVGPDDDLSANDMLELERLIAFLADCWEVERGTFEPLHKKIAIEQE